MFKKTIIVLVIGLCWAAPVVFAQTDSGYAPVNGLKLYYEVHGEGEPVLLLHGLYMTIDLNYGQLIQVLKQSRRVIAVELQGHGRTTDIDRPLSYEALADDVAGLLKHLNIDRADILGYSFGGTVALQFGITHPGMVRKMIILSTVYTYTGWQPEVREVLKNLKPESFEKTPLKSAYQRIAPDPNNWTNFLRKYMEFDTRDFDLGADNIKAFAFPVLLIMGDNDGVELSHKTEMYRLCGGGVFGDIAGLPKSQLAIFPGTTHVSLMMGTQRLASVIEPFLSQ